MWNHKATATLAAIALTFAIGAPPVNAASSRCEDAPLDDLGCMHEEYQQANDLLAQKIKTLLSRAQKFEPGEYSAADKKRIRSEIANSIVAADGAWRLILKNECETLLMISFGHGTGGDRAALRCKINRIYERISSLSKDETYEWLQ